MSLLPEFIPAAFPLLALSHFVALVSPGPDFFLLAGYAIRYRLRGSAGIGPGIALGNAFYIVLAMCGWRLLQDYGLLFRLIEIAGALYLIWIGGHLLRSRKQVLALNATRMDCPSWRKQFLLGLGSALLNPKNALFYLALMTSILGADVTFAQQIFSGAWMSLAVLAWNLAIATLIGLSAIQIRLTAWVHMIERIAGAVLAGFGVAMILTMVRHALM
ncbi:LysE family translocator [Phytobacter sp. SCO41]|uniref:LysE family translocator n=1 Tax=Citrobacter bitternis TaxID=1585982 RepID=A0ABW1Q163_9ENTR|nr:LysE family transporter [Phytobacter sp. SCO41]